MPLPSPTRRDFLTSAAAVCGSSLIATTAPGAPLPRPTAQIVLPRNRVPLAFIIDDSTCLVNMGRFCMPQFATAWPDREEYRRPWRSWPAEIPDDFVRRFGQWCAEHGVRGKYSIVPYPACVGWLDRELPGWSHDELQNSLKLVRELMVPNWDIHPEMITHTRVIDLTTGRPFPEISPATMENSFPQEKKSVDQLASYLAYALRILKNCDLPCEGITTPGGFGNLVKPELSLAVREAVMDVFAPEIPHYFKYVVDSPDLSTAPLIEGLRTPQTSSSLPEFTVNVRAGTGDWFGGWDGNEMCQTDLYLDRTGQQGRMAELIRNRQPAVMICHWPGMYGNGSETGFQEFQRVVLTLEEHYRDETIWMKLSEMARYWAAKELARLQSEATSVTVVTPFSCPNLTLQVEGWPARRPLRLELAGDNAPIQRKLQPVANSRELRPDTYWESDGKYFVCADLPGQTTSRVVVDGE